MVGLLPCVVVILVVIICRPMRAIKAVCEDALLLSFLFFRLIQSSIGLHVPLKCARMYDLT